jgi:3-deoxy-D-manno-octulosonic-acid transferase
LPNADSDIYVADTIGELGTLYAATPVAFIGGSLIRHGGQNPIEAVRLGAVPITGASTYNFTDAYAALLDGGGAIRVEDGSQLTPTVLRLMGDPDEIDRMRIASTQALLGLSGALERTVAALLPHLPAIEVARRVG